MPEILRRVGRYDLIEVIGRGGAAVVYLARQRDLHRHVALKELAPFHADDPTFAERFVEESRLAGSLSHANVVTVHEYFEDSGVPYIAMEYLPHGSLRQYVGTLSTAQIAGVLEGVLAGLSHGEAHGIAHRDLKPENLLIAADGRVKIADFGVARAYNKAVTRPVVTAAGTTIGTPAYMAPEQALGGELTASTDLYSLGIIAWELLTGQVPFEERETPVAVLYRHVHEPVPRVSSLAPEVDERLEDWVQKMLVKRPEDRFQSADAAWEALEDAILELRGPRWRREARLLVEGGASRRQTLTPASFGDGQAAVADPSGGGQAAVADPGEGGQAAVAVPSESGPAPLANGIERKLAPVAETVTGREPEAGQAVPLPPAQAGQRAPRPVGVPAGSQTTVPPKRQPREIHTTMFRIARRHRDGQADAGEGTSRIFRRRALALVILLAMAAAAAGGWALAETSGRHRANSNAAAAAAREKRLTAIVEGFGATHRRDFSRLLTARTPAAQAQDAARLQADYSAAAGQLRQLQDQNPKARSLRAAFTETASAYGTLASAAAADDNAAYNVAKQRVTAAEQKVAVQIQKL